MEWDAAIIGGGASGLAAAVTAAEAGARTLLLEASDRVGRSILVSGNGRCNFSNAHIDADEYHNAAFVREALIAFESAMGRVYDEPADAGLTDDHDSAACGENPIARRDAPFAASTASAASGAFPNGVVGFFHRHGLLWREEAEGRLYPQANKASVVLDVLRASAAAAGVEVRCESRVRAVEAPRKPGGPFMIRMEEGDIVHARDVVVACGGRIAHSVLPEGFVYDEPHPVLGPIATDTRFVKQLDKIRVRGSISLVRADRVIASESGELMFRRYGVSGIAAFNLSRLMQPGDQLRIDMLGGTMFGNAAGETAEHALFANPLGARAAQLYRVYHAVTCEDLLRGMVLPPVADVLCAYAGVHAEAAVDERACHALWNALTAFTLEVRGIGDESVCQVRRGGFNVKEFDPASLQARAFPGLHVTGEALDVDGPCGGYNLHWAFASGISAGRSAAAHAKGDSGPAGSADSKAAPAKGRATR